MRSLMMAFRLKLLAVFVVSIMCAFGFSSCRTDSAATPVPISSPISNKELTAQELIDSPSQFDGKEVVITGLASIKFENTAIRPTTPTKNKDELGVWLQFSELKPEYKKFDGKHVRVHGTFSSGKQGHFGMFSGAITNIKEIAVVEK